MRFKASIENIMADFEGNLLVTLKALKVPGMVEGLQSLTGVEITAEIKKYAARRTLDSNNYMWALLSDLAAVMETTKEELYLLKLREYGSYIYLPVTTDKEVQDLKQVFRLVIDRGQATVRTGSGKLVEVTQLQCFKGSSCYDGAEMKRLLDGIVRDCREAGIDTMTDTELQEMNERWGLDFEKHRDRRE